MVCTFSETCDESCSRWRRRVFVAVIGPMLSVLLVGGVFADGWRAGVAKANITPGQPMWMAGYGGRDRPAEGKLTDLWAKALVLEDAERRRAVLVTLDLVGISRDLSESICDELGQRYGVDRSDVAINVSHTHTGPAVGKNLGPLHYYLVSPPQQRLIDQYAARLRDEVVATVGQAIEDLQSCRLRHGTGEATFAVNRRENRPEAQVPALRADDELAGPYDHRVPVLAITDESGKRKAVVFGYACHATVLSSYEWSGDYPGFAQAELERLDPDCQAMFWAGCGADQNPLPRRTVALAEHYGRRLAAAVEAVLLTTEMTELSPALRTEYAEVPLALDSLPDRESLLQQARSNNRFEKARAEMLLAQIDSGKPLSETYPYPIGTWVLGGDVRWVFLGGEVVVDYATRISEGAEGSTWVAGYSNDVMAYIPSRRVLREGGYEGGGSMVYYGLPTIWAPEIERDILDEVARQATAR